MKTWLDHAVRHISGGAHLAEGLDAQVVLWHLTLPWARAQSPAEQKLLRRHHAGEPRRGRNTALRGRNSDQDRQ